MTNPVFHHEDLTGARPGEVLDVVGPEARHAVTVRRLRAGEPLDLVDGHGTRATCVFRTGERDRMGVLVADVRHEHPPDPRLTLVQALAKGDRDLQAVESATELGVSRVVPWQADRSIVRLRAERAAKTMAKWESLLATAAKQSRRAAWPRLEPWVDTAGLARLVASEPETLWLVLHESAPTRWTSDEVAAWGERGHVAVVVGPEGGISEDELRTLRDAGARPLRLGSTVMRSSTAGPAALAALSAVLGSWD
ncbi:16S rRNA (uracil(1498)-N(3))-methyltransferase [Kocuria tytonicola]|uniref:Ribosomal RNA small subunit methyltransferase E n=1 Tax=Kocuria tytonicola TaxID=2055946 RepID=A0A3L9L813_9MICC|nr:16S rRNA (uracil(1498)-N(3))-methyltransferase [Kocuria tytonicola]RLY94970.1 16S rRNA (uracil(1498)-N(3))-methyltransferase [Kocuria tytonicola]